MSTAEIAKANFSDIKIKVENFVEECDIKSEIDENDHFNDNFQDETDAISKKHKEENNNNDEGMEVDSLIISDDELFIDDEYSDDNKIFSGPEQNNKYLQSLKREENDLKRLCINEDNFVFDPLVHSWLKEFNIDADSSDDEEQIDKNCEQDENIMIHHYKHRFCLESDQFHSTNENLIIDHIQNIIGMNYYCFCGENFAQQSKSLFYQHLWEHGGQIYRCKKCTKYLDTMDEYERHLINEHRFNKKSDSKLIGLILLDAYKKIKRWVNEFYTFAIERQALFFDDYPNHQQYCSMCQVYRINFGLLMKTIASFDPIETTSLNGMRMLDHQCKHMAYYRYVCLICLNKYNLTKMAKNSSCDNIKNLYGNFPCTDYDDCLVLDEINKYSDIFLTLPNKHFFHQHIIQYHEEEFDYFDNKQILFKRWMKVDLFEQQISQTYGPEFWKFDDELFYYTKFDIEKLLNTEEKQLELLNTNYDPQRLKLLYESYFNITLAKPICNHEYAQSKQFLIMLNDFRKVLNEYIDPVLELITNYSDKVSKWSVP